MTHNKKSAAALHYAKEYPTVPQITALGKGMAAENIIQKAKEHDIPIIEDPSLVECLAELKTNDLIPMSLFDAVAEVFAFIYEADRSVRAYIDQNEKQSDNKA